MIKKVTSISALSIIAVLTLVYIYTLTPDFSFSDIYRSGDNECTIIVASGSATSDGRPLMWKNRDVTDPVQSYYFIPARASFFDTTYAYTGNFYSLDSTRCFMGVNEAGFAIINANCYNLPDQLVEGMDDGDIMKLALEYCADISDWEHLLEITNLVGRKDCWNFGAMDASGNARLYECSNYGYTMYDSSDPEDAPNGIIVRTVFAFSGSNTERGKERHKRAKKLVYDGYSIEQFNARYILDHMARDLYSSLCDPYPLPYVDSLDNMPPGHINTEDRTINRYKTRSCSIIRGILPGEDPRLMTTFAMLGQPALSVSLPLWVASGSVPHFLSVGDSVAWFQVVDNMMQELYPNNDSAYWMNTGVLFDTLGEGAFTYIYDLEHWALDEADSLVDFWLTTGLDSMSVVSNQNRIAQTTWFEFSAGARNTTGRDNDFENRKIEPVAANYPNPFNATTTIDFTIPGVATSSADLKIYNVLGEQVRLFEDVALFDGHGSVTWDGRNQSGNIVGAGVYYYNIVSGGEIARGSMMLLK